MGGGGWGPWGYLGGLTSSALRGLEKGSQSRVVLGETALRL